MDPLAALAQGAPAPSPTDPAPQESSEVMAEPPVTDPVQEDQIMLLEDFRTAPAEDALAAFEALLSAFNVKRS